MIIKQLFALLFLIFSISSVFAQETSTVSGKITDSSSKSPVESVTIQLLKATDNSIVAITQSGKKGTFSLEKINNGNYILQCSFIGAIRKSLSFTIRGQMHIDLGTIELSGDAGNLKEVVVTAEKSLLNTGIDRKVYNVSRDIMAQSGSATDILKNIPSVEVDIDGQVSLRGSGDVMILINGRPSPLMGRTKNEVLQQLPANSIERIEVITNPSARYKPDGTSGIINIVLKKAQKSGWNGNVIANTGNRSRYNSNINLNYKPGKLNVFSNISVRQDSRLRLSTTTREYLDASGQTESYYSDNNRSTVYPHSVMAAAGFDYAFNDKNSIGLSGNYYDRRQKRRDVLHRFYYDAGHAATGIIDRLRYDPEKEQEKDATAYWQHNFGKEDKDLRVELNTSASDETEDNHYSNTSYYPVLPNSYDNTLIRQGDHQQQVTIDYTDPLTDDSKLEAGYSGSYDQVDLNFYGELYDTTQKSFVKDIIRSNRFKYSEAIHALYATYQRSYKSFGYSAGLRLEQAFIKGNLITKDSLISNQYFKVYPTLHLSYKLKTGELQLNYSKRVHRPEGDDLNPFPEYQDPLNLRSGNPKLLPEMIHSIEFGYKWQNDNFSFVPSIYYRYKKNGFTSVIIPFSDSVLLSTIQNLSNDQSAGLELIFSAKTGKFLSINLSTNFFYNKIDASNLGYSVKKSILAMNTTFNATATLTKTTMWQVSSSYRSARLTPQGKISGSVVVNSGFRQDLFKKKVSLTVTASDLFNTLKQRGEFNPGYLKQVTVGKRDARIFYAGISYRFGKTIKNSSDEKLQFDNNL